MVGLRFRRGRSDSGGETRRKVFPNVIMCNYARSIIIRGDRATGRMSRRSEAQPRRKATEGWQKTEEIMFTTTNVDGTILVSAMCVGCPPGSVWRFVFVRLCDLINNDVIRCLNLILDGNRPKPTRGRVCNERRECNNRQELNGLIA